MIVLRQLDVTPEGFAFDPATGDSYTLNPCAQLVWQRLQQGELPQKIASFLADEFGIAQRAAERDVTEFVQQINTLGLGEARR